MTWRAAADMRHPRSAARVLCALLCALPAAAFAQNIQPVGRSPEPHPDRPLPEQTVADREQPDFAPDGIHLGSFVLFPSVAVGEAFDDNIYAAENGTRSDFITVVEPRLFLRSNWSVHRMTLEGAAEYRRYYEFTGENVLNGRLTGNGEFDLTNAWRAGVQLGSWWDHEDRGSWEDSFGDEPTPYQHSQAAVYTNYKASRIGLDAKLAYDRYAFSNVGTSLGTVIDNSDRDRHMFSGELKGSYEIVPNYDAFLRTVADIRQYDRDIDDLGFRRHSQGWRAEAGVEIDLTGLIVGEVFAGYLSRRYDDASFDTVSGPLVGASLFWNPTPLTTVSLRADRAVSETTVASASGILMWRASVGVDHELLRNLVLGASAEVSFGEYADTSREDVMTAYGAYAKYSMNRNVFMSADYTFTQRDSSAAGLDYDRNRILLRVGYRL